MRNENMCCCGCHSSRNASGCDLCCAGSEYYPQHTESEVAMDCESCGKFKKYETGCSESFVPDSALTTEEFVFRCKDCTSKHGVVPAPQSCRTDMCSNLVNVKE